jgi:transposase
MLRPEPIGPVPDETARIARAAFPKGNLYLRLADEMGALFTDEGFADLYPTHGQPSLAPWRLVLVTILQFAEDLSDRQAADAVRSRIDWKYVLHLDLGDPGFDASVLSEFRSRLLEGGAEGRLLDLLLAWCREKKLLKAGGKQRSDSTHVLAAVRALNRVELVVEAMRAVLNDLAVVAPDWARSHSSLSWVERYARRAGHERLPTKAAERDALVQAVGDDGRALLQALFAPATPAWLREIPTVNRLRQVWVQQYVVDETGLRWRTEVDGLPPSSRFLSSPYDPDAHLAKKGATQWVGFKIHLTETCEEDLPELITNVETTPAPTADGDATPQIHAHLKKNDLLPKEHLVDTGYLDAQLLLDTQKDYDVDLVGPTRRDYHWQGRADEGFAARDFTVDWDTEQVTCPAGRTSHSWTSAVDNRGADVIKVKFSYRDCSPCAFRPKCFRSSRRSGRRALTLRPKDLAQALQAARVREKTVEFDALYDQRAGIEGTLSRGIRTCGLRQTRYLGMARTHLGHVLTAVALNFLRLAEWFAEIPRPKTRVSPFVRLMNPPLLA